ncbi:3-hydroxyacyl-CoA dehydrogenase NAD-binding domain-containing protein [Lipingzhangella sp. LS1_29]|uniref:3-hydroxyacyl-CoA dehydrogenase NAD-binding domain-containing protein n=1 Tax=Lipingzhangella rawalii TaxID=2055835 RepID=A0ABU2H570_9ACTN|nr:3-hydroxyacyl-CoA dehydrogenase NAD-binding domain-containing protein [Lipingzhangella rawalii]MDS1270443.1 3-hydroxyacyl-CoA dehydrogenase NAD-binding domain-containing protein [Lipingzhangella rawalii]
MYEHTPHRPESAHTVACIGAGVIGGGWVAHFLARGYRVVAWDPAADAESKLRQLVDTAWPALTELGLAANAGRDRLRIAPTLEQAVAEADFVQESAPERLDLKIDLLAQIDAATPAEVVIGSSTSGYSMSEMQIKAQHPERLVVGHPFNPPYLVPLVEVVGGAASERWAVDWAAEFYRAAGKSVLTLDRELPGFIGNRIQEAAWREALHMVANGEATVAQIDQAMTDGPGLRWAFFGPCLTFHLAGGTGGMAHMLDHFGPALQAPWTRMEAPHLTQQLRDAMVTGTDDVVAGREVTQLIAQRDRRMIAVLRALEEVDRAETAETAEGGHRHSALPEGATGTEESDVTP